MLHFFLKELEALCLIVAELGVEANIVDILANPARRVVGES